MEGLERRQLFKMAYEYEKDEKIIRTVRINDFLLSGIEDFFFVGNNANKNGLTSNLVT